MSQWKHVRRKRYKRQRKKEISRIGKGKEKGYRRERQK